MFIKLFSCKIWISAVLPMTTSHSDRPSATEKLRRTAAAPGLAWWRHEKLFCRNITEWHRARLTWSGHAGLWVIFWASQRLLWRFYIIRKQVIYTDTDFCLPPASAAIVSMELDPMTIVCICVWNIRVYMRDHITTIIGQYCSSSSASGLS